VNVLFRWLDRMEELVRGLRGPPGTPGIGKQGRPGRPGKQGIPGRDISKSLSVWNLFR
jgi:hypothetical protein